MAVPPIFLMKPSLTSNPSAEQQKRFLQQFQIEVALASRLRQHPNIINTYGICMEPAGIVMVWRILQPI